MVVDQSMKGVEAAWTAVVQKCEPRRRGHDQSVPVGSNIRHMCGDQSLGPAQHLKLFPPAVKEHKAVGRGHRHTLFLCSSEDAVHAEHMLVFYMGNALEAAVK